LIQQENTEESVKELELQQRVQGGQNVINKPYPPTTEYYSSSGEKEYIPNIYSSNPQETFTQTIDAYPLTTVVVYPEPIPNPPVQSSSIQTFLKNSTMGEDTQHIMNAMKQLTESLTKGLKDLKIEAPTISLEQTVKPY